MSKDWATFVAPFVGPSFGKLALSKLTTSLTAFALGVVVLDGGIVLIEISRARVLVGMLHFFFFFF